MQAVPAELTGYAGSTAPPTYQGHRPSPGVCPRRLIDPNSELWTRPRRRPSSSMRRRFLQRKEPDCPVIVFFSYSDCEIRIFETKTSTSPQFRSSGSSLVYASHTMVPPPGAYRYTTATRLQQYRRIRGIPTRLSPRSVCRHRCF